jgi:hypothetical protein
MLKNAPIVPYIPATDVARARTFYEGKVGLVPREEVAGVVVVDSRMKPAGGIIGCRSPKGHLRQGQARPGLR